EALGDLIEAETEAQRKLAVSNYSGALRDYVGGLRQNLLRAIALTEASIDFADEEIPEGLERQVAHALGESEKALAKQIAGFEDARRIRTGIEIAIVGAPNVGKSTLVNALVGDDIAIVTDIAGTTRDVIEARLSIGGQLVTFLDTAGLRETDDPIEREGVRRAQKRAEAADLRIFLSDTGLFEGKELFQDGDLTVLSKGDLTGEAGAISALTGEGLADLQRRLKDKVSDMTSGAGLVASLRQQELLLGAVAAVQTAQFANESGGQLELVAHHIRSCLTKLEQVIGRIDVEDVLGEIFSSFCIGK
ncbi:MAG: GTPase, partial [Pseudomonadota bacterium]